MKVKDLCSRAHTPNLPRPDAFDLWKPKQTVYYNDCCSCYQMYPRCVPSPLSTKIIIILRRYFDNMWTLPTTRPLSDAPGSLCRCPQDAALRSPLPSASCKLCLMTHDSRNADFSVWGPVTPCCSMPKIKPQFLPASWTAGTALTLTLWSRSSSKCYLRIQSVPQREHHTSPLQRSTG
jgi:hypothetical protein